MIEPFNEQPAIWELGQAVVVRQKLDLSFCLSSLGYVLVCANPAAVFEGLMMYRDLPAIASC